MIFFLFRGPECRWMRVQRIPLQPPRLSQTSPEASMPAPPGWGQSSWKRRSDQSSPSSPGIKYSTWNLNFNCFISCRGRERDKLYFKYMFCPNPLWAVKPDTIKLLYFASDEWLIPSVWDSGPATWYSCSNPTSEPVVSSSSSFPTSLLSPLCSLSYLEAGVCNLTFTSSYDKNTIAVSPGKCHKSKEIWFIPPI